MDRPASERRELAEQARYLAETAQDEYGRKEYLKMAADFDAEAERMEMAEEATVH